MPNIYHQSSQMNLSNPYLKSLIHLQKGSTITGPNNPFTRIKSAHQNKPMNVEKEKLYEDCINLKSTLNAVTKELAVMKSEVHKRDMELAKKNKVIAGLAAQNNNFMNLSDDDIMSKAKENNLLDNVKKQYKDLKKEIIDKEAVIESLKKRIKMTKIGELEVENRVIIEELNKMKARCEQIVQKNNTERYVKPICGCHDKLNKNKATITQLQDQVKRMQDELDKAKLKSDAYTGDYYLKKLE